MVEQVCIGDGYGECGEPARYIRHTQFAGSHPLCDAHARRDKKFMVGDTCTDWEALPHLTPANDNHVQVGTWPKVIAFTGLAGAGKSTAADILTRRGYSRVKFAGPLKAMMRAIGLTESQIEGAGKERPTRLLRGNTPRYAMQRLGTEWGRDLIGEDFWTFLWEDAALKILDNGGSIVTDDCRFANEVETVRALGGVVFRVSGRGGIAGAHSSEEQSFDVDHVIENTGTLDELESKVITAMEMAG